MHGILLPEFPVESDDWYEARRRSLGASEVAAALGLNPPTWPSAYAIWAEKTGRVPHPEASAAMRMGQWLEPFILKGFTEETGLYVVGSGQSWRHPDVEWATASPDGLAVESPVEWDPTDEFTEPPDDPDPLGLVEAKTDFNVWHDRDEEPASHHVPDHYMLQVHWQLYVLGLDQAWVVLFATGTNRGFYVYEVARNDHLIDVVVEAATEFWHYVETDTEPPVDASETTKQALNEVYWDPVLDAEVEISDEIFAALSGRERIKAREKALAEERSLLENQIRQAIGDATHATYGGRVVATWKPQTSRHIDSTRLREERPDIAAEYETESTFRVLRPKKKEIPT